MVTLAIIALNDYAEIKFAWRETYYINRFTGDRFKGKTRTKKTIEMLEYLHTLCRETRIDPGALDTRPFLDPDLRFFKLAFITDKKKINEIFTYVLAERQALAEGNLEFFKPELSKALDDQYRYWREKQPSELLQVRGEYLHTIENLRNQLATNQKELSEIDLRIANKDNLESVDVVGGLRAAFLAVPFFKFVRFRDARVYMETTADCVLEEKNPAAGVHRVFNFGRFEVRFHLAAMGFSVHMLSGGKNTVSGNYYHPHVSNEGKICWGDSWDRVNAARLSGDFVTIFRIIAALITSYSREVPYRDLHSWIAEKEARERGNQPRDASESERGDMNAALNYATQVGAEPFGRFRLTAQQVGANMTTPPEPTFTAVQIDRAREGIRALNRRYQHAPNTIVPTMTTASWDPEALQSAIQVSIDNDEETTAPEDEDIEF